MVAERGTRPPLERILERICKQIVDIHVLQVVGQVTGVPKSSLSLSLHLHVIHDVRSFLILFDLSFLLPPVLPRPLVFLLPHAL